MTKNRANGEQEVFSRRTDGRTCGEDNSGHHWARLKFDQQLSSLGCPVPAHHHPQPAMTHEPMSLKRLDRIIRQTLGEGTVSHSLASFEL